MSKRFGIPSPSESHGKEIVKPEKPMSSTSPDEVEATNSNSNDAEESEVFGNVNVTLDLVDIALAAVIGRNDKLLVAPFATVIVGAAFCEVPVFTVAYSTPFNLIFKVATTELSAALVLNQYKLANES